MLKRVYLSAVVLLALTAFWSLSAPAEEEGCFDCEDIEKLEFIANPVISPNGERVAYVLSHYPESASGGDRMDQDIWMAFTDKRKDPFPFAFGPDREANPRWSPSGDRLAFISNREGKAQVFWIDPGGGEAERVTSFNGEVLSFSWSPDGGRLAAVIKEERDSSSTSEEGFGGDEFEVDEMHRNARLWLVDSHTGEGERVTGAEIHVQAADWSPDGGSLALIVSDGAGANSAYYHSRLEILDIESGNRKVISENASRHAEWSRDGRRILFTYRKVQGPNTVEASFVAVIGVDGEGLRLLGSNHLGTLSAPRWHPDGKRLVAIDVEGVRGKLSYISIEEDEIEKITDLDIPYYLGNSFDVSGDGKRIVTLKSENTLPPQLWLVEEKLFFGGPDELTGHNEWLSERKLPEAEIVEWKSRDGTMIEGVLFTPPGFDDGRRYPSVVNVHGGPMWAWWHGWHGSWHEWAVPLACRGFVVLLPNPRGSMGYGAGFARANFNDWGGGDFEDVVAGAEFLVEEGYTDPAHIGIGGWSYGGYLSSWALTHTGLFKAAVVGAGVTNLFSFHGTTDITPDFLKQYFEEIPYGIPERYSSHSPVYAAAGASAPTLILHG